MTRVLSAVALLAAMGAGQPAFAAGDAAAGEKAYTSKGCVGCHGPGGASVIPANPALKGKDAAYIVEQLNAFRSGARQNPTMNAMAKLLNDADVGNVAAYLSAQ